MFGIEDFQLWELVGVVLIQLDILIVCIKM